MPSIILEHVHNITVSSSELQSVVPEHSEAIACQTSFTLNQLRQIGLHFTEQQIQGIVPVFESRIGTIELSLDDHESEALRAQNFGYRAPEELVQRIRNCISILLHNPHVTNEKQLAEYEIEMNIFLQLKNARITLEPETETERSIIHTTPFEREADVYCSIVELDAFNDFDSSIDANRELRKFLVTRTKNTFEEFYHFLQGLPLNARLFLHPEWQLACKQAAEYVGNKIMGTPFYFTIQALAHRQSVIRQFDNSTIADDDFVTNTDIVCSYLEAYWQNATADIFETP